mmetsp:Transcript_41355/g.110682  ORF Transcript_41355/g.110682 Transcript_41355/m.110682 type:complete len:347 (+) Transcript_41355:2852-3892(+)
MMEGNMVSVERLAEYASLPPEDSTVIRRAILPSGPSSAHFEKSCSPSPPPPSWPFRGELVLESVELRYGPERCPALRGVSFSTPGGERIGVVGRTGAGKSSLAAAVLRLRELWSGRVVLDGLNLRDLALADLRARLAVVPQEPLLLVGSVRFNLDPHGTVSDEALWAALDAAAASDLVRSLPGGLDAHLDPTAAVDQGLEKGKTAQFGKAHFGGAGMPDPSGPGVPSPGGMLSAGQRQLLCLARAIARGSRLVIMDEATACVDPATEARLEAAMRKAFRGATLLCIAHRLRTILACDRVLVMSDGMIVEDGAPVTLANTSSSVFNSMVTADPGIAAAFRDALNSSS